MSVFIKLDMYIKIRVKDENDIVVIAKFCGMSPCQVFALNRIEYLEDIAGREFFVKIELPVLVRDVGKYYVIENGRILKS